MIVTVTPNPSLDLLFDADRLVWDDANRLPTPRRRPGGQGINVVRALRVLAPDAPALAIAALGGATGRDLAEALRDEGTPIEAVPIEGESRIFVGVRESATGRSLLLNPRGPTSSPGEAEAMIDAVRAALDRADSPGWLAACGSLLPGFPADFYARVGRLGRERGWRFVPDCDGPALAAAAPLADLLVPNESEAARLVGRPVAGPDEAADAGRTLLDLGARMVVVTLGGRGAVAVTPEEEWRAAPVLPRELSRSATAGTAVGAGDVLLAAFLTEVERGMPVPDALARAVAAGTAVLLARGSELVSAEAVERVLRHVQVAGS